MMNLRVERVEVWGVEVPLIQGYKNAYRTKSYQRSAIVRVTATGGAVGLGNIDPSPGYSVDTIEDLLVALRDRFGPALIGMDPTNIHRMLPALDAIAPGLLDAKAALEMACVDLTARACGVPVHTYLGGAVKDVMLFNAWIGILPPDEAAAETVKWQKQGFRSAKIKVGGDINADRDRVKAIREAVGPDFKLRIDANAGYDADTSIKLARMVLPYNLQLFEQPVPDDDIAGMARVRREAGGMPIMADESILDHASLIAVIKADAADIVKVKVMKQGGFHRTLRMIATAEAAGIRCVVGHGFGLGVNTMAEVMLSATQSNVIDGIECVGPLKTADDIVTNRIDLSSGTMKVPDAPGLGVTLDEAKLAKYRFEVK